MGRVKVEDLPANNVVSLQIEVHQGALRHDEDRLLGRLSEQLGGPKHRELRRAFADWMWHSLAPGLGPEAAKVPKLKGKLRKIAELGEFQEMKSLMLKVMVDHWMEQGMEQGVTEGMALARADERLRLCRQVDRKFGGRVADRLAERIYGVTDAERLAEIGDWIIDCGTEAEFLALAESTGES